MGLLGDAYSGKLSLEEGVIGLARVTIAGMYSWDRAGANSMQDIRGGTGDASDWITCGLVFVAYILAFRLFYNVGKVIISLVKPKEGWAREKLIASLVGFAVLAFFSGGFLFFRTIAGVGL